MARGGVYQSPVAAVKADDSREDVGAKEGKVQFGATVVKRNRENQCATTPPSTRL